MHARDEAVQVQVQVQADVIHVSMVVENGHKGVSTCVHTWQREPCAIVSSPNSLHLDGQ